MTRILNFCFSLWALTSAVAMAGNDFIEANDPVPADPAVWASLSGTRVGWGDIDTRYSRSLPAEVAKTVKMNAWRGERLSAQIIICSADNIQAAKVVVGDLKSGKNVISSDNVETFFVRYTLAGYPKVEQASSLEADRLDACSSLAIPAQTTRPVWVSVRVPSYAVPGTYKGNISIDCDGKVTVLPYQVKVCERVLPEPSEWQFHLDLWQNPYAVARYFNVPLWSEKHFELMRPIVKKYADAGGKVITTSIIRHPWNGQTFDPFESMVGKMKHVDGSWSYDYTVFDTWVEFMMSCGVKEQISCYTIVPWQYQFDWYDCATNSVKLVDCKPQDPEYRELLLPFLKDFAAHLKQKGWFDISCIAMDERPMDQMNAAYKLVKEADPGYRISGAANYNVDSEEADKIHDMSVIYHYDLLSEEAIARRKRNGQILTFYTCCSPAKPNTFTFSDPAESAFIGWHAAAVGYDGYLRWALNSWPENPCHDSRFGKWNSGDTYLLYPEGSSIRFERLVEGIQDYEKIRILKQSASEKQKTELDKVLENFAPSVYDETQKAADLLAKGKELLLKLSGF